MKTTRGLGVVVGALLLGACASRQEKFDRAAALIRQNASFDLGCPSEQIQVTEIQRGTMMAPAVFGAACGDKRARYLYRAGAVLRN